MQFRAGLSVLTKGSKEAGSSYQWLYGAVGFKPRPVRSWQSYQQAVPIKGCIDLAAFLKVYRKLAALSKGCVELSVLTKGYSVLFVPRAVGSSKFLQRAVASLHFLQRAVGNWPFLQSAARSWCFFYQGL